MKLVKPDRVGQLLVMLKNVLPYVEKFRIGLFPVILSFVLVTLVDGPSEDGAWHGLQKRKLDCRCLQARLLREPDE